MNIEFLATTTPGLERVAIREVEEITQNKAKVEHRGMITFKGREEDIFRLNYLSKSLHRVLMLLLRDSFSSIRDIYKKVFEINFAEIIRPEQRYAVRAERHGEHSFTSQDVEREVGQAIIDSFKKRKNVRLKVDLENPDLIFRVHVRDKNFWFAVDTTGEDSLHKRGYRIYQHPASLRPTIAYCMVRLSQWNEKESLIDPMCGSGTICIEAGLFASKIPNWFRQNFAFWNLSFLDTDFFVRLKRDIDSKVQVKDLDIQGCDLFEKHVKGAKENANKAGIKVKFFKADATRIPLNYDKIVTNMPYGVRIGSRKIIEKLYKQFILNLYRYNWKKTVVLTARVDLLPIEKIEKRIDITYGKLPASILIIDR